MGRNSIGLLGIFVCVLAVSTVAMAQPAGGVDIGVTPPGDTPPTGPDPGLVIEVNSGDVETIWFHIIDEPGSLWHLQDWSVDFIIAPSGPEPPSSGEVILEHAMPSTEYPGCSWFKLADIQVTGPPCTTFTIPVSIDFGATGGTHGTTITKHIIPEPATMLMLGAGGVLVLLRKRRRS